jgi:hypothetical protein
VVKLSASTNGRMCRHHPLTVRAASVRGIPFRACDVAPGAAAVVVVAALCVPWLRTGTMSRSAFAVVGALRAAGLVHRTPAVAFVAAVALVPGLAAATWILAATAFRRVAAVAVSLAGSVTVAAALGLRDVAHHRAAPTLPLATAGGALAVVVGVASLVWFEPSHRGADRTSRPTADRLSARSRAVGSSPSAADALPARRCTDLPQRPSTESSAPRPTDLLVRRPTERSPRD